jgi:alpha-tubulin suppressor-like RCC1 family protein
VYSTGANEFGQLGLNHYEHEAQPRKMNFENPPIITDIYCGYAFTMLLTSKFYNIFDSCTSDEGHVYAVGSNSGGQLALGVEAKKICVPTRIVASGFDSKVVTHVSCGQFHTIFVTRENEIYMSGRSVTTEDNLAPRIFAPERIMAFYDTSGKILEENTPPISYAQCGRRYTIFATRM